MNLLKKTIWLGYVSSDISYGEYYNTFKDHIGWTYSYKGKKVTCIHSDKETAFHFAFNKFQEVFGIFGVIEDDITFNPILN